MGTSIKNWWTTGAGIFTGIGQYWAQYGTTMPQTKAQWASFLLGLGIAALGVLAKDGFTKPPTA